VVVYDRQVERALHGVGAAAAGLGVGLEGGLVEEVGAVGVAVEIGRFDVFKIGLLELLAGLESLVEDGARQQVAHLEPNEGLAAAVKFSHRYLPDRHLPDISAQPPH